MKRVKAACICQTLHFQLKEDVGDYLNEIPFTKKCVAYERKSDFIGYALFFC